MLFKRMAYVSAVISLWVAAASIVGLNSNANISFAKTRYLTKRVKSVRNIFFEIIRVRNPRKTRCRALLQHYLNVQQRRKRINKNRSKKIYNNATF